MKKIIALTAKDRANLKKSERNKPFVDAFNTQRYAYRQTVLSTLNSTLAAIFEQNEYIASPENAVLMVELMTSVRELKEMSADVEKGKQEEFIAFIQKCTNTLPLRHDATHTLSEYLTTVLKDQDTLRARFTDAKQQAKTASSDECAEILAKQKTDGAALFREINVLSQTQLTAFLLPDDIVGNEKALSERFGDTYIEIKEACTEMDHLQTLKEFYLRHSVNKETAAQFAKMKANTPTWGQYFRSFYSSQAVPTQAVVNKMQEMASRYKPQQKVLTPKNKEYIIKQVKRDLQCMRAEIDALQTIFEAAPEDKTEEVVKKEEKIQATTESIQKTKDNFQVNRHLHHLKELTPLLLKAVQNTHLNPPDKKVFTTRFPSIFSLMHFATMYEGAHRNGSTAVLNQARKDFMPFMKVLTAVLTKSSPEIAPILSKINAQIKHECRLMAQLDHETDDTGLTMLSNHITAESTQKETLVYDELKAFSESTETEVAVDLLTEDEIKEKVNTEEHPSNYEYLMGLVSKILHVQELKGLLLVQHTQNRKMRHTHLETVDLMQWELQAELDPEEDDEVKARIILSNLLAYLSPDEVKDILEAQVETLTQELPDIRDAINEQFWEGIHEMLHSTFNFAENIISYVNIYASLTQKFMLPVLEQALPLRDMQRDLIGNVTTIVLGATGCYLMGAPNLTVLAAILGPQFLLNKLSEQIASLKVVQQLYSKLESVPRIKTVVDFTMTMTGATKDLTLLALAPFTAQWTAPGRGELAQILVLSGLASGISNLLEMGISALNQTERNPSRKTAFGIGIQMVLGNIAARLPDFTEQLSPEWADWLKEMAYDLPKLSFITNGLSEPYEEGYTPIEELCKEFDTLLELHGKGPKRVKKEYRKLAQGIRSNNAADKRKAEANAATKAARELWKTVSSTDTTPARPISSYELGEAFYKAAQASHEASPEGIDEKFRQLDMCKDAASREYIIQTIYDAMASGVSDFRETMGSYSQFETLMTLIHYMKRSRSEA